MQAGQPYATHSLSTRTDQIMNISNKTPTVSVLLASLVFLASCTQESQNKIGRSIQNWTGTDGTLEVYAGEKLVKRFMKIDKLTTAAGTSSGVDRPYRFGYGVLDSNLNGTADNIRGLGTLEPHLGPLVGPFFLH